MTIPPRPSHRDGDPTGVSTTRSASHAAERRRQALRRFLARHDLTPTDLAHRAGMNTPNAIYNFLKGRSDSLSQRTIERILATFPGTPVTDVTGWPAGQGGEGDPPDDDRLVRLLCEAQAGTWRAKWHLPEAARIGILIPDGFPINGTDLFGVRMRSPGAELLYPDGSLLICRALDTPIDALPDDSHMIVRRQRRGKTEITVRELRRHEGQIWLWWRSTDPHHQEPLLAMPAAQAGDTSKQGTMTILGAAIARWTTKLPIEMT